MTNVKKQDGDFSPPHTEGNEDIGRKPELCYMSIRDLIKGTVHACERSKISVLIRFSTMFESANLQVLKKQHRLRRTIWNVKVNAAARKMSEIIDTSTVTISNLYKA